MIAMRGFSKEMGGQFWHEGRFDLNGSEIHWQAKVYPSSSEFGIDGGRVSKLWVSQLPPGEVRYWQEVAYYDRGWCTQPLTPEAKQAVDQVLKQFQ